jgi:hypothetical protein
MPKELREISKLFIHFLVVDVIKYTKSSPNKSILINDLNAEPLDNPISC